MHYSIFTMRRAGFLVVGCIVLAWAVWIAWAILRDKQLRKSFDEIETGATEQEVLQKLGQPKRVGKCGDFFGPLRKDALKGCDREYFYPSPFAPLLPQYYVVSFDAKNRVEDKMAYSSP